jgi:hypothetical protein
MKDKLQNISQKMNMNNKIELLRLSKKMSEKKLIFSSPIVFSLIFILSLGGIIYYLFQLKSCMCFEERNKEYKVNINYLLFIDIILFILYVILFILFMYAYNQPMSGGGGISKMIQGAYSTILIVLLLLIVLTLFFLFYVYKLSLSLDESCSCSNSKLKYLLYAQSVLSLLFVVSLFVALYNTVLIYW